TLSREETPHSGGLSVEELEARLQREVKARIEAEQLLEDKSRSLYQSNQALEKVARNVEEQRQQLDVILDNTVAGIFLANESKKIVRANRAGLAMFQLDNESVLDKSVLELFEDNFAAETLLVIGEMGEKLDTAAEAVGVRGEETFPIEFAVTPVVANSGKSQSVWIFRDITRRKHEEAKRAAMEKELNQAQKLEALGTLASGVAHEINTPIQYVGDNLRFLQDVVSDLSALLALYTSNAPAEEIQAKREAIDVDFLLEEAPESILQSLHGMEQVARIVKAIKEFSHPGANDDDDVDINETIETAVTLSRNQWKYVAETKLDLASGLPKILCSGGDLNQVFVNMIVNAADAIEDAGADGLGEIRIRSRAEGDWVEIEIADTGCGMVPDTVERIFDPFFTTKDVGRGSGQGLAISYNIIRQKYGGEILCQSTLGEGTRFCIRLPASPDIASEPKAVGAGA
ncbi:MAG: ATP-binding protein, partial [Pseudomonadota bacterium]